MDEEQDGSYIYSDSSGGMSWNPSWMGSSLSMRSFCGRQASSRQDFGHQVSSRLGWQGRTERDASEGYVSLLTWSISKRLAASRERLSKDVGCNTENVVPLVCMRCGKPPLQPGKPMTSPGPKRPSRRSVSKDDDGAKLPIPKRWPMLLQDLDGDWVLLSKGTVNPFFRRLYIDAPDVHGGDGSTARIKEDHEGCMALEGGSLAVLLVRTGKSGSQMVYLKVHPDLGAVRASV